ncbi:MAG: hypothetical protein ACFFAN_21320 [Promethearchaeota archaeon]
MKSQNKEDQKKLSRKGEILSFIFLIISVIVLLYLYYLLTIFGLNLLFIALIIIFVLLVFIGPFFLRGRKKKRFYSRMFPDKKQKLSEWYQSKREREGFKVNQEISESQTRNITPVDLNYKYRKPIIRRCENCKMIVPNFAKKCLYCGEPINR